MNDIRENIVEEENINNNSINDELNNNLEQNQENIIQEKSSTNFNESILKSSHNTTYIKSKYKGDELFRMHKSIQLRRDEIVEQGKVERHSKLFSGCTFSPKILGPVKNLNPEDSLHKSSYDDYLEKKNKYRQSLKEKEDKFEHRVGSGNIWKKKVTVPENFIFKTQNLKKSVDLKSNYNTYDNKNDLKKNQSEGIKISEPMNYDSAVNYLRFALHSLDL